MLLIDVIVDDLEGGGETNIRAQALTVLLENYDHVSYRLVNLYPFV